MIKVERLLELLSYDPVDGTIFSMKTKKRLFPDEEGCVGVYDNKINKRYKFKYNRLCWILGNKKIPTSSDKLIHRNMNEHDCSLCNLHILPNEEYKVYKNAVKNLSGGIRVSVHPTDMYSYRVHWYESGIEKTQTVADIVVAKRLEMKLKLRFNKILTKFCYTDL